MASIYDSFADSCAALAAKTKRGTDKVRLLQLADQWKSVSADGQGPGRKPPAPVTLGDVVIRVSSFSRPVHQGSGQDEYAEIGNPRDQRLEAQLETKTERAKAEALEKANAAIGFLRELGIDNETILKELGFKGRASAQKSNEGRPSKDEPCPICNFRTDPAHDGRAHRSQTKKKAFSTEELQEKGLAKRTRRDG
jgi:hypothetical protein